MLATNHSPSIYHLLRAALMGCEAQGFNEVQVAEILVQLLQPDEKELDTHGAARFLGKSAATLERWRVRGTGPKYRKDTTGAVRYRVGWLKDHQNSGSFSDARTTES